MTVENLLRDAASAGCAVRPTPDGLMLDVKPRPPADLKERLRAAKPELLPRLVAVEDARPRIAVLLRALRRLDVTIARGTAPGKFWVSDPAKVTPELRAEVKALVAPLDDYLLTRELFGPAEVNLRAEPMRHQIRRWQAAHPGDGAKQLPFLVSRPLRDGEWPLFARCFSCGDALANDPGWDGALKMSQPYFAEFLRCSDCRAAVERVEAETGARESRCFCGGGVHRFTVGGDPLCAAHDQPVCLQCRQRPHTPGRWLLNAGGVERFRLCPYCEAPAGHRVEVRGEERAA